MSIAVPQSVMLDFDRLSDDDNDDSDEKHDTTYRSYCCYARLGEIGW